MFRHFLLLSAPLLAAVACGADSSPGSDTTGPPPLAQVSTAAPTPSSTRKPGPPVKAACPLVSRATVAAVLKVRTLTATERDVPQARVCRYQAGTRWIELYVAVAPATTTAEQTVGQVIRRYSGELERVPALGDAAFYSGGGGTTTQALVTAQVEGAQMRTITIASFLDGDPKNGLVKIARGVLRKV